MGGWMGNSCCQPHYGGFDNYMCTRYSVDRQTTGLAGGAPDDEGLLQASRQGIRAQDTPVVYGT